MKRNGFFSASVVLAALVTISMIVLWSGCGKEQTGVTIPEPPAMSVPAISSGAGAAPNQFSVPGDLQEIFNRLRTARSESEAQAILQGLPADQQKAMAEALQVARVDTQSVVTQIAPPGLRDGRAHSVVTYHLEGRNMFGTVLWHFEETVTWDHDGTYVYNPVASVPVASASWPWTYSGYHQRPTGWSGWRVFRAEAQGRFHCVWAPWPMPVPADTYPYLDVWVYPDGNSRCPHDVYDHWII